MFKSCAVASWTLSILVWLTLSSWEMAAMHTCSGPGAVSLLSGPSIMFQTEIISEQNVIALSVMDLDDDVLKP